MWNRFRGPLKRAADGVVTAAKIARLVALIVFELVKPGRPEHRLPKPRRRAAHA